MSYIKKFKLFKENITEPITFESIVGKYTDVAEFSDYKSKFIITKLLESEMSKARDSRKPSIDTLNQYAEKLFTNEGINTIRDYKNSDWIKALDITLTKYQTNYPNVVSDILKAVGEYDGKGVFGMIVTNIRIFKTVLSELNGYLPSGIQFNFSFKGLVEITDKNFLKLILFYKDKLFTKEKIQKYKGIITNFHTYSQRTEEEFIKYLADRGIKSRKAELKEDVKGIDVIDEKGITYQVKAPQNIKVYKSGYFIPNSSKLDTRKIKDVDKLVFYLQGNFSIIDTNNIEIEDQPNGIFIRSLF